MYGYQLVTTVTVVLNIVVLKNDFLSGAVLAL